MMGKARGPYKRHPPVATVDRYGYFLLNIAATDLLHGARTVIYAYDKDSNVIAIIPASPDTPDTYALTVTGGCAYVCARAFLKHFKIDRSQIRKASCLAAPNGHLLIPLNEMGK